MLEKKADQNSSKIDKIYWLLFAIMAEVPIIGVI